MIKVVLAVILASVIVVPVTANEIAAPEVFDSGQQLMPQNTDSFGEGLLELLQNSIKLLRPDLQEATEVCGVVIVSAMLFTILPLVCKRANKVVSVAGTIAISTVMLQKTNSMVGLASATVRDILEYGKLLCQVMTVGLAAQGCISSSSALYIGTTLFAAVLNTLFSRIIIPMIFLFLVSGVAYSAFGDDFLKKAADLIKGSLIWTLKLMMIIFTTYMSITGAVSGTTDLAALKTTKIVISSAVPVVGGILSDSSEAVLVSLGVIKNAAGIYGMLAVLSIFAGPFLKIGMHYLLLKVSAALCAIFGDKRISTLTDAFSGAMGLLLAVIAAGCMLIMISTVCFLKGAS